MKTYFVSFNVTPSIKNEYFEKVAGAIMCCWILDDTIESAYGKATFQIEKYDWHIDNIKTPIQETDRNFFEGKDLGQEYYDKAQKDGFSLSTIAWSRDGETTLGPVIQKSTHKSDIADFIKKRIKIADSGRCLHYDTGVRCGKIIKAHSIQRSKSLESIAENGHVYVISQKFTDIRNNFGRICYKKEGINNVSTFKGFCDKHDNELFEPIDNQFFIPSDHQVCLYAYRSICRELFVKENSLKLWEELSEEAQDNQAVTDLNNMMKKGLSFSLINLTRIKRSFDAMLESNNFECINYVAFVSSSKQVISFSGLFYPEFDFLGNQLQDLSNQSENLRLITFCSAPMSENKWGFVFAWHKDCADICKQFIGSIAYQLHEKKNIDDFFFRLIICNSENHAISPNWWENLSNERKEEISILATQSIGTFHPSSPEYLMKGLEGIAKWDFEYVIPKYDK